MVEQNDSRRHLPRRALVCTTMVLLNHLGFGPAIAANLGRYLRCFPMAHDDIREILQHARKPMEADGMLLHLNLTVPVHRVLPRKPQIACDGNLWLFDSTTGILITFLSAHVGNAMFGFCVVAFDTKCCRANAVRHCHLLSDMASIDFETAAIGFQNACAFATAGFQTAFGIPECIRVCDTWIPENCLMCNSWLLSCFHYFWDCVLVCRAVAIIKHTSLNRRCALL